MPLLSFIKRLVSAEEIPTEKQPNEVPEATDDAPATEPTITTTEESKQPPPPPPPPPSTPFKRNLPPTNTSSTASLRSRVELERKTASSASIYTDFTSGGHADAGHWNDPPTTVFKKQQRPKPSAADTVVTPSEIGGSNASSFMVVDNNRDDEMSANDSEEKEDVSSKCPDVPESRADQVDLINRVLHGAVDAVDLDDASPMIRRMAEDTAKRLTLMDDRLGSVDEALVAAVCAIAMLVDACKLNDAANAHRDLLQTETHTSELRWLVGVKRVIELLQKNASSS
ncbi:hypothetical protein LPJ59_005428 [Coemansia sp. RSA 2399]|nr:hypothetical protein LPJ59_005428 [Coemansia sp. RSA 2399]KAJ1893946.1 hypothetical protein LPJ81_005263 [Coemansia sp. IMI 209127]